MKRHLRRMMQDLRHRERDLQLRQLRKRIGSRTESAMEKPPLDTEDDWEFDDEQWDEFVEMEQQHRPRLKHEIVRRQKRREEAKADCAPATANETGIVFTVRKGRVRASVGGELVACWLPGDMAATQKTAIAVGDEVVIAKRGDDRIVAEVLPRRTTLARPDPYTQGAERVVAANVDLVVQVSAAKNPPLRHGLIDRYLVAIERGGAAPAICVNKVDLLGVAERNDLRETLVDYETLGVSIVWCSTKTGEGMEVLRELVRGRSVVLVGHSGVGKSSLLNALDASLEIATNSLHKAGKAGRHTTSSSTLHEFPDGTRLIDTPGIREFGLGEMTTDELRFYFPEFGDLAMRCRFRDCTHLHEPSCAVKAAAEAGELRTDRYARYVRLSEELRE